MSAGPSPLPHLCLGSSDGKGAAYHGAKTLGKDSLHHPFAVDDAEAEDPFAWLDQSQSGSLNIAPANTLEAEPNEKRSNQKVEIACNHNEPITRKLDGLNLEFHLQSSSKALSSQLVVGSGCMASLGEWYFYH